MLQDGNGVISNDGGSVISNDGGSVISNDGGSLMPNDVVSGFVSHDGGSLRPNAVAADCRFCRPPGAARHVSGHAESRLRFHGRQPVPQQPPDWAEHDPGDGPLHARPAGHHSVRGSRRDGHAPRRHPRAARRRPRLPDGDARAGDARRPHAPAVPSADRHQHRHGQAVTGPVLVALTGLPAGVTVATANTLLAGSPAVTATNTALAPGASVRVRVDFLDPTNARFSYGTAVYTGAH